VHPESATPAANTASATAGVDGNPPRRTLRQSRGEPDGIESCRCSDQWLAIFIGLLVDSASDS
jgi:hypothetical protein